MADRSLSRRWIPWTRAALLLLIASTPPSLASDSPTTGLSPEVVAAAPDSSLGDSDAQAAAARPRRRDMLFEADFDRGSTAGFVFDRAGVWSVVDGRLRAALPKRKQVRSLATLAVPMSGSYALEVDVHGVAGVDKGVVVGLANDKGVGVDLRAGDYRDVLVYRGFSQLGRAPIPNRNGRWYRLRVEVTVDRMRVFVDRALALDIARPGDLVRGRIALAAYTGGVGECEILFDNVEVTRFDAESASGM